MNLELFNNLLNNAKENKFVQNFMKELSNYLEKGNNLEKENDLKTGDLKQENTFYQVVDMDVDGAYLQNTKNNKVSKETDIPKELLEKIGNDTVLQYKNGEYVIDEEMTQKFFDSLVGVKELSDIKDNFAKESNILEIDANMNYKLQERKSNYAVLSYGDAEKSTIEVPNELIPFWTSVGENLHYKNGAFKRD